MKDDNTPKTVREDGNSVRKDEIKLQGRQYKIGELPNGQLVRVTWGPDGKPIVTPL